MVSRVALPPAARYGARAEKMETDYKVKLEVFEGPLDLLLYLIKRDEIDIYDIPIGHITRGYLEYLSLFQILDLDIAGDFVVMAANLIYIKSRGLLPKDLQPPEEAAEEDDPRWELVRQLIEYKKFKDAAGHLGDRELERANLFLRAAERPEFAAERPLAEVSTLDLFAAFNNILKRLTQKPELREIFEENFTVSDKIGLILKLTDRDVPLRFGELFVGAASRTEIVVTFLALLELVRLKQIRARQGEVFGEIEIVRAESRLSALNEPATVG